MMVEGADIVMMAALGKAPATMSSLASEEQELHAQARFLAS